MKRLTKQVSISEFTGNLLRAIEAKDIQWIEKNKEELSKKEHLYLLQETYEHKHEGEITPLQNAAINGNIEASLIELEYKTDLENAQISAEIIDQIIKHDFGMVRSIKGPNLIGLLIGFICAFITGLFACKWMIAFVKKAKLKYFSFYCFAVGIISISYSLING